MSKHVLTLRLPLRAVLRADGFVRSLRAVRRDPSAKLVQAFAFKNDERPFARRVLEVHSRIWLFRCNQHAFAGDFVAVDMSSRDPAARKAWGLDLKQGAPIKLGGGGAGTAFLRLSAAIREIATLHGVLTPDHPVVRATGDGQALARLFDAA
ncbi:MAG: hypothetical protein H6719_35980 [Sandaracinaceae bacterium]|nr:hypothetical protein [Sandaracinaceae bacterium]